MSKKKSTERKQAEELLLLYLRNYYLFRGTHKDIDDRIKELVELLKEDNF